MPAMSRLPRVMLIRHAEKPAGDGGGVSSDGRADPDELSVTGWQRAGALARLFAVRPRGMPVSGIVRPTALYAVRPTAERPSRRTASTLEPLARLLGVPVRADFGLGDELALVRHLRGVDDDVLIAWEHNLLPMIAVALAPVAPVPGVWPDDRYDVVWTVTWSDQHPVFRQVPQLLLPGDRDEPIG